MTLLRLATGLARSSAPEHRWRRLAVPLSALVFMLLLLAATSVVVMVQRQNDRDAARRAEISSRPGTGDVFLRLGTDVWRDDRIVVAWIEPAAPAGDPVLPPGMERFPRPGEAVVSPELARLIDAHPGLAGRFGRRPLVLDEQGLQTGGELLAYVRPRAGRRIGGEAAAVRRRDGRWLGRGPVARVSGFGRGPGLSPGEPVSTVEVAQAAFGLLGPPALIVLMIGLAAASRVRDHRFQVLAALGAPRRTVRALAALEALVLTVPALVGAAVLWAIVTPQVEELPLLDYRVVGGDLVVPPWLLAAEFLAAMALSAGGSVAAATVRRRRPTPRPTDEGSALSRLALLPPAGAVVAFVLAALVGGDAAPRLNALGITLAVAGIPLMLPALLRAVGELVGRSRAVALSLAGSAMTWDPRRLARPFMGLGALVVVALVAAGYTALMLHSSAEGRPSGDAQAVSVEWGEPRPGDLARLDAELDTGLVVPFQRASGHHGTTSGNATGDGGHAHGAGEAAKLALGASCPSLAAYVHALRCDPADPYALPGVAEVRLATALDVAASASAPSIRLVPRSRLERSGAAFTLDDSSLRALDERTRAAAMTALPAPRVESAIDREPVPSPLVGWIGAGGTVAAIALSIACLLSLVDRLLADRQQHRHLLNLGISPSQMTGLAGALFAVPYAVMSAFGLATGLVICFMLLDPGVPVPWSAIAATVGATLAVGALGTGLVAAYSSRQTLREAE